VVAGGAVPAAAHRELEATLAGDRDHTLYVGGVRDPHDRAWALVHVSIEDGTRLVVVRAAGTITRPDAGEVRQFNVVMVRPSYFAAQLNIQRIPNRSTRIPKYAPQN
jgi:hypothetical protein